MTYSMTDLHEHIRSLERDLIREGKARKQLEADHAALLRLVEALPKTVGDMIVERDGDEMWNVCDQEIVWARFYDESSARSYAALLTYRQGRP